MVVSILVDVEEVEVVMQLIWDFLRMDWHSFSIYRNKMNSVKDCVCVYHCDLGLSCCSDTRLDNTHAYVII